MFHKNPLNARRRLLHRIGRRYRVVTEDVQIAGRLYSFTRIANPDHVLDEVAAEADLQDRLHGGKAPPDQLHLPYWAEVWDSGRGMGKFLISAECKVQSAELKTAENVDPRTTSPSPPLCTLHSALCTYSPLCTYSTLDLGCGMGMAGMVAASMGARVVFADLEAPALLFAQLNSLPWSGQVETRRVDWQRDRLNRRFDLILGSDILYERAQWPFLETFWREHLAEAGQVLLGEPGRQTGDLFVDWITSRGWELTCTEVPVATRARPIRIFALRPRGKTK